MTMRGYSPQPNGRLALMLALRSACPSPKSLPVEIVRQVKAVHPDVPVIGFPKGAGKRYRDYRKRTGITSLGIDWTVPLSMAKELQGEGAVQGNLDPLRLVAGGKILADGVDAILRTLGGGPLIFNLGHGITPETPVAHVEAMVKMVRSHR